MLPFYKHTEHCHTSSLELTYDINLGVDIDAAAALSLSLSIARINIVLVEINLNFMIHNIALWCSLDCKFGFLPLYKRCFPL